MRLTIPQVIMMNHAAHVNQKRAEESAKRKDGDASTGSGKRVSEMDSTEYARYFANLGGTVNVIPAAQKETSCVSPSAEEPSSP